MTARWLWVRLVRSQRGETTEKVIITALFAALALTVATIITVKVTQRAESIPLGNEPAAAVADGADGGVLGR